MSSSWIVITLFCWTVWELLRFVNFCARQEMDSPALGPQGDSKVTPRPQSSIRDDLEDLTGV